MLRAKWSVSAFFAKGYVHITNSKQRKHRSISKGPSFGTGREQQSWREKILSENWDAPVVYTTMVQLLESLFGAGTRGARRMHQLANAVVVFDEVQALPIKCVHLFNNAVNFLVEQCNSTVVPMYGDATALGSGGTGEGRNSPCSRA